MVGVKNFFYIYDRDSNYADYIRALYCINFNEASAAMLGVYI